jgi:purine nucleosidase
VPVYSGAAHPLKRKAQHAQWYHGRDGLGDRGYPPPKRAPEKKHAVDAIIEVVSANPGIVMVTLGPLTNVAMALSRTPQIVRNVSRCIVMGGAPCVEGNVTPAAEYNIWVDPEAARTVFHSGLPIEMVGWQLCRGEANLKEDEIAKVLAFNTPLARFAVECNSVAMEANRVQTGEIGISLPDPTAMAVALDPAVCLKSSRHLVEIETVSELTRGMTVVDLLGVAHDDRNRVVWAAVREHGLNATVCWQLDVSRFKEMLYQVLR